MRRVKGQTGMSLVEATIILLVLMLLTGVLAPSIFDYVRDAQMVKVKEDCEAIGLSVARLTRDVGPCLKFTAVGGCTLANRVDILASRGDAVALGAGAVAYAAPDGMGGMNWNTGAITTPGAPGNVADFMENQFTYNSPAYNTPGTLNLWNHTFPSFGLGWRGAYLPSPIGPDPWGGKYLVNSMFLAVASDSAAAPGTEGAADGGWDKDVFCISAGPNKLFDTPFATNAILPLGSGTFVGFDDFTFIISGDTR